MKFVGVFILLVVIDFAWSYYIASVKDGKAVPAAAWSAFMMALQGIAAISYVNDPRLLGAAVLGAFVGTFLGVKIQTTKLIIPTESSKNATETNQPTERGTDSIGPG